MIELRDIHKTYPMGGEAVRALRGVSLSIEPGEFIAIMGPSGSGKSTLLHVLGLLDRPDSGTYRLMGADLSVLTENELAAVRNKRAGFVFQQFHLLKRSSALENVELPLIYAGRKHLRERAAQRLQAVGLAARMNHRPNELSGGEQQRVAIARSLVNDPPIIFADEPTGNLDTASEKEIMKIVESLNQSGKTVILVTHELEVAEHAHRLILMRDGNIVSDRRTKPSASLRPPSAGDDGAVPADPEGVSGSAEWMDHFREATRSIWANKLRSFLSILGILIGVAAVITMLALGEGAKESISKRLASMGSNLLVVRPGSLQTRGVAMEAGSVTRFTLQDAEAIARLEPVRRAAASVRGRGQLVYGNKNWNTQVQGVDVEYEAMRSATPVAGRFFTEEEKMSRERVALLGQTVARELYGDENPVGTTIKINRVPFVVIGLLPEKGSGGGWGDDDDVVVVPINTAMYRLLGKTYVDAIDAEAKDPARMDEAEKAIYELIRQRQRIRDANQDTFQVRNIAQMKEALQTTTQTMTYLLGSIAAISLLVGGIGIMNIMLVSVTERTREIGLRKAIGAKRSDIMGQFLIESVVLTVSGGLAGIALGLLVSFALAAGAGWAAKVSIYSVVISFVFSVAVGLVFGLWPARQASRLDPIHALRYE